MTDSLSDKMRALAASHPCGAELKAKADEFDEKTKAHYSAGANRETAKRMLGAGLARGASGRNAPGSR